MSIIPYPPSIIVAEVNNNPPNRRRDISQALISSNADPHTQNLNPQI